MTIEQCWALEHMNDARKKFGEEYTENGFKTYMKEQACCGFEGLYKDEPNSHVIDNKEANETGIKALQKLVGVEGGKPIDLKAIEQINFDRLKKMDLLAEVAAKPSE